MLIFWRIWLIHTVFVIEQNVFELKFSNSDIAPRITASSTTTAKQKSQIIKKKPNRMIFFHLPNG
jgi:hypothetical protein